MKIDKYRKIVLTGVMRPCADVLKGWLYINLWPKKLKI